MGRVLLSRCGIRIARAFEHVEDTALPGGVIPNDVDRAIAGFEGGPEGQADDLAPVFGPVGSVARLRAAWAQADTASRTDLAAWVKPLDQPGSPWRQNAQEVLAYADYRAMDTKSALTKYSLLATDPESPQGLRNRAQAMVTFLKSGGAVNFGTVPAEAAPLPPQTEAPAPTPEATKRPRRTPREAGAGAKNAAAS